MNFSVQLMKLWLLSLLSYFPGKVKNGIERSIALALAQTVTEAKFIRVDPQLVLRSFRPAKTLSPGLAKEDPSAVLVS
jgi:hypothetical protein